MLLIIFAPVLDSGVCVRFHNYKKIPVFFLYQDDIVHIHGTCVPELQYKHRILKTYDLNFVIVSISNIFYSQYSDIIYPFYNIQCEKAVFLKVAILLMWLFYFFSTSHRL